MITKSLLAAALLASVAAMSGVASAQQNDGAQTAAYADRNGNDASTICTYQGGPKNETWNCR